LDTAGKAVLRVTSTPADCLILIPFALFAVWMGSWWLAAGCAAFCAVMMLEWCRMSATPNERLLAVLGVLFCLSLPFADERISWALFGLCVALGFCLAPSGNLRPVSGGFRRDLRLRHGLRPLHASGRALGGPSCGALFHVLRLGVGCGGLFLRPHDPGPAPVAEGKPEQDLERRHIGVIACAGCGYLAAGWQGAEIVPWILRHGDFGDRAGWRPVRKRLEAAFQGQGFGHHPAGHGGLLDRVDGLGAVSICATLTFLSVPHLPRLLGL
jgi:phosphatidate cytidylyltransferase